MENPARAGFAFLLGRLRYRDGADSFARANFPLSYTLSFVAHSLDPSEMWRTM